MADKIIRATAKEGMIRIIAADAKDLVNYATKIHNCTPTAAAALGRMLVSGALMSAMLKSEKESLTLKIDGGGEAKGIIVTTYSNNTIKGYIGNPNVNLPLNSKGKLDVSGAIGKNGSLAIIKDLGLKDPYIGQVPIYTGEVAEDFAYYFTVSEQTPSAVSLGVLVDKDYSIKSAGGFIIQMMPGADDLLADLLTYRLQEIPPITSMLSEGKSIEDIIKFVFEDMDIKINDELTPKYECDCSRDKVEKALISIGAKELENIYKDNKDEEVKCHFCNTSYKFTNEQIGKMLEESKNK